MWCFTDSLRAFKWFISVTSCNFSTGLGEYKWDIILLSNHGSKKEQCFSIYLSVCESWNTHKRSILCTLEHAVDWMPLLDFPCLARASTHSQLSRVSHLQLLNNPFTCICCCHDCNFNHTDTRQISGELATESCLVVTWVEIDQWFLACSSGTPQWWEQKGVKFRLEPGLHSFTVMDGWEYKAAKLANGAILYLTYSSRHHCRDFFSGILLSPWIN